jgi:hypothetical protein
MWPAQSGTSWFPQESTEGIQIWADEYVKAEVVQQSQQWPSQFFVEGIRQKVHQ